MFIISTVLSLRLIVVFDCVVFANISMCVMLRILGAPAPAPAVSSIVYYLQPQLLDVVLRLSYHF